MLEANMRKGAFALFPIITNMEEFLIHMGGGIDRLSAHFGDEPGGPGFSSEALAGDSDTQGVSGPCNGDVQ